MEDQAVPVDSMLVDRIVNNDPDAIVSLLLDLCGTRLSYLVNVKYRSVGWQFDDLISEMYLLLSKDDWRVLKSFRGQNATGRSCSLVNYVVLIASRLMRKRILSGMHLQTTLDNGDVGNVSSRESVKLRMMSEVMQAIQTMDNSSERDILILVKIHGFDFHEVAKKLNISVDNAYARCSRAVKHLRELMNEEGIHA